MNISFFLDITSSNFAKADEKQILFDIWYQSKRPFDVIEPLVLYQGQAMWFDKIWF